MAGMRICCYQNRCIVSTTGAVVMRATFAVLVMVLCLGGVVVRAAFAVLVMVLCLSGVVMVMHVGMRIIRIHGRVGNGGNKA